MTGKLFLGEDRLVPEAKCPKCGKVLDGVSGLSQNDFPDPGDVGVCIGCASVLVFMVNYQLRLMTNEEIEELAPHEIVKIAIAKFAIKETQKRMKPH